MKYLGINLTQELKNLCTETYKPLIKETEEDATNLKISHVHVLVELILLKCS